MNARNIFTELKRRNVYKVAVAYAVVGWLLIQVATQVFPFLEIPNWTIRLVILLTALGFPIALIIAWAFELTPEGVKRTEDADAARQHSRGVFGSPLLSSLRPFRSACFSSAATRPELNASTSGPATASNPAEIDRRAAAGQHQWRSQQRVFFRWPLGGIDCGSGEDSRAQGDRPQLLFLL